MKKNWIHLIVAGCFGLFVFATAQADDVTTLLESAQDNYSAKRYSKALEDLDWARKEIVSLHLKGMKNLFPESIDGMKGMANEGGEVLGVRGISRVYSGTDGQHRVTISLMGGESASGGAGLGALMGMAAAFGAMEAGSNAKLVIAKGYKGQFIQDPMNGMGTLTFTLSGGKALTIETMGYPDASMAEKVAKMLDIAKIEATF